MAAAGADQIRMHRKGDKYYFSYSTGKSCGMASSWSLRI
jgi:hypothetical protein